MCLQGDLENVKGQPHAGSNPVFSAIYIAIYVLTGKSQSAFFMTW